MQANNRIGQSKRNHLDAPAKWHVAKEGNFKMKKNRKRLPKNVVKVMNSKRFRDILISIVAECLDRPASDPRFFFEGIDHCILAMDEEVFRRDIGKLLLTSRLIKETMEKPSPCQWEMHTDNENERKAIAWVPDFSDLFEKLEKEGYGGVNPFTSEGFDMDDPHGATVPCQEAPNYRTKSESFKLYNNKWYETMMSVTLAHPPHFKYPGFEKMGPILVANLPKVFWADWFYKLEYYDGAGEIADGLPGEGMHVPGFSIIKRMPELAPEPVKAYLAACLSEGVMKKLPHDWFKGSDAERVLRKERFDPYDMEKFKDAMYKHHDVTFNDISCGIYTLPRETKGLFEFEEEEIKRLHQQVLDDFTNGIGALYSTTRDYENESPVLNLRFYNFNSQLDYLYLWSEHLAELENALIEAELASTREQARKDVEKYGEPCSDMPTTSILAYNIDEVWDSLIKEAICLKAIRHQKDKIFNFERQSREKYEIG